MMTLRGLCALLIIGILVEPALQTRVVRKIRNHLAIIIDQSKSMSLPAHSGSSRADAVKAFLNNHKTELQELSDAHVVEFFNLEGPIADTAVQQPPHETNTDLMQALKNVQEASAGKPLA